MLKYHTNCWHWRRRVNWHLCCQTWLWTSDSSDRHRDFMSIRRRNWSILTIHCLFLHTGVVTYRVCYRIVCENRHTHGLGIMAQFQVCNAGILCSCRHSTGSCYKPLRGVLLYCSTLHACPLHVERMTRGEDSTNASWSWEHDAQVLWPDRPRHDSLSTFLFTYGYNRLYRASPLNGAYYRKAPSIMAWSSSSRLIVFFPLHVWI